MVNLIGEVKNVSLDNLPSRTTFQISDKRDTPCPQNASTWRVRKNSLESQTNLFLLMYEQTFYTFEERKVSKSTTISHTQTDTRNILKRTQYGSRLSTPFSFIQSTKVSFNFLFQKKSLISTTVFFLSLEKHYPVDCSFFSHFSDTECAASVSNLDDQVAQVSRCL